MTQTATRRPTMATLTLAFSALLLAGSAFAEDNCSRVPEQYRATCEQGMKANAACVGLQGEARKHCMQRHIDYVGATENCATLAGEARLQCEQHNRLMQVAGPCSGKAS
ncbi:MAG TPA: hypothetical protein VLU54_00895, partial [Casimicrobiaceae bacterium]|nr:hypothetical protein [Casimicrobiaceae bacterium]